MEESKITFQVLAPSTRKEKKQIVILSEKFFGWSKKMKPL